MPDLMVLIAEVCEEAAKFAETHQSCQNRLFETADREVCPSDPKFDLTKVGACCADGALHAAFIAKFGVGIYGPSPSDESDTEKLQRCLAISDWLFEESKAVVGTNFVAWNDTRYPKPDQIAKLFRDLAVRANRQAAVAA